MRVFYTLMVCVLFSLNAHADYERNLKAFAIEDASAGQRIHFILDNDWVLVGEIPFHEANRIYCLPKLEGTRAYVTAHPQDTGFELLLENPKNPRHHKMAFSVALPRETYDALLTVNEIEVITHYVTAPETFIHLSDGSKWLVRFQTSADLAAGYWARGDRVLVTKKYTDKDLYVLVNPDVSGEHYIDYYKGHGELWYSMRDPRSVEAKAVH